MNPTPTQERLLYSATTLLVILSAAVFWAGREAASWRPVLIAHAEQGANLTLSPDGSLLATDQKIFDLNTGKERMDLGKAEYSGSFSGDGRLFIQTQTHGGGDEYKKKVAMFSLPDLKLIVPAFDLNDATIVPCAESEAYWFIQNIQNKIVLKRINLTDHRTKVVFSTPLPYSDFDIADHDWQLSSHETLFALNTGEQIKLYRLKDSHLIRAFPKTKDFLGRFVLSPNASFLADTDLEGVGTRIFDVSTGKQLWQLGLWFGGSPLAFSPNSRYVVAIERDFSSSLKVRAARTGKVVRTLVAPKINTNFSHVAWSPDGRHIFVSDHNGDIWKIRTQ